MLTSVSELLLADSPLSWSDGVRVDWLSVLGGGGGTGWVPWLAVWVSSSTQAAPSDLLSVE